MDILRISLIPFSFLYAIVIYIRNFLFDFGIFKSKTFDIPIISVGNLSTGGSGKSPMIEYLISVLGNSKEITVLSRGYGRKTQGYLEVNEINDYTDFGDEPLQIKKKFKNVNVVVCENRVDGANTILRTLPTTKTILLDDAFQHRWIKPGLSILLIPYHEAVKTTFLLPAGNQREPKSSASRADILIISKSPPLSNVQKSAIANSVIRTPNQKIYFSGLKYGNPTSIYQTEKKINLETYNGSILLLTGIANPLPLKEYLKTFTSKVYHTSFPDHHEFFERDLDEIRKIFNNIADSEKIIITTEKDSIRLDKLRDKKSKLLNSLNTIYYIPVEVTFSSEEQEHFNQQILNYVRKN